MLVALLLVGLSSCSQFGQLPSGKHLQKIKKSNNFSKEKEQFVNRRPNLFDKIKKRMESKSLWFDFFFGGDNERTPKEKLPEVVPNLQKFLKKSDHIKVIWLGHSTLLINWSNMITI